MKTQLYSTCLTYDFKKLFKEKGYAFFTKGIYNLNIIGIRSNQNKKLTNVYDDYLVVDYETSKCHKRQVYSITTEPGSRYMFDPTNVKGVAILAPGQYRATYKIDLHNGKYTALCQRNKPVKVYRDGNKDDVYDLLPQTLERGMFGINIHRSNKDYIRKTIDMYSAGCQVFDDPREFGSFMSIVKKAAEIWGNCFTYTLLDEEELV